MSRSDDYDTVMPESRLSPASCPLALSLDAVVHVFDFLEPSEMFCAALCSKLWLLASFNARSLDLGSVPHKQVDESVSRVLLSCPKLERLRVDGFFSVEDAFVTQVCSFLPNLWDLSLHNSSNLVHPVFNSPRLQRLVLSSCLKLTNEFFELLPSYAPNLVSLNVSDCMQLSSLSLAFPYLQELIAENCIALREFSSVGPEARESSLRIVRLNFSALSASSLLSLISKHAHSLFEISLLGVAGVSSEMMSLLGNCSSLRVLRIGECENVFLTEVPFALFRNLRHAELPMTPLGDSGVASLVCSMPLLEYLDVSNTNLSRPLINFPLLKVLKFDNPATLRGFSIIAPLLTTMEVRDQKKLTDEEFLLSFRRSELPALLHLRLMHLDQLVSPVIELPLDQIEFIGCSKIVNPQIRQVHRLKRLTIRNCIAYSTDYVSAVLQDAVLLESVFFSSVRRMETFNFASFSLRRLVFFRLDHLTEAKIKIVVENCNALEMLSFNHCRRFETATIGPLPTLRLLEFVNCDLLHGLHVVVTYPRRPLSVSLVLNRSMKVLTVENLVVENRAQPDSSSPASKESTLPDGIELGLHSCSNFIDMPMIATVDCSATQVLYDDGQPLLRACNIFQCGWLDRDWILTNPTLAEAWYMSPVSFSDRP
jgi:hypothetical protein